MKNYDSIDIPNKLDIPNKQYYFLEQELIGIVLLVGRKRQKFFEK